MSMLHSIRKMPGSGLAGPGRTGAGNSCICCPRNNVRIAEGVFLWIVMNILCVAFQYPGAQSNEYLVKGIFLERFTRFIEWPEASGVEDTSRPFIVGVIGQDPFNALLDQLYKTQKIKNKNVEVRYLSGLSELDNCNLLFISRSEKSRVGVIIDRTRYKPILTVSDFEDADNCGVIINLRLVDKKVRFEIDEQAARDARLYMSHLLLKEAIIIDSGGRER